MQDEQDVQNENLVTDDAAASISDVSNQPPAGGPQAPGQQFTPDPSAADPVGSEPTIGDANSNDDIPAFQPPEPEKPAEDAATATPEPTPVEVPEPTPVMPEDSTSEDNASDDATIPAESEKAEQTPQETPTVSPFKVEGQEVADTTSTPAPTPADDGSSDDASAGAGDLDEIKKKALEELTPLVDQLDLEPAKRYDLLMEIIQAGNHDHLLKDAYEAAHSIEDDNLRAQALMEVVNEVEYLKGDHEE